MDISNVNHVEKLPPRTASVKPIAAPVRMNYPKFRN
jgi:hypothetical protein